MISKRTSSRLLLAILLTIPALPGDTWAASPIVQNPEPAKILPVFDSRRYTPAVLRFSFTEDKQPAGDKANSDGSATGKTRGFLDVTLIPPKGNVIGRRVDVTTSEFAGLLRSLYRQLAKQDPMDVEDPKSAARLLYGILFGPVQKELRELGITTLLISADPGLQGVPFAALHDGSQYVGTRYALSLTPSIGLMPLNAPVATTAKQMLAVGASNFEGLSPLPLVPQELSRVGKDSKAQTYINEEFTPQVLLDKAGSASVSRVHVATHAEFLPGGPSKAKLFSGVGPMTLDKFSLLRQRRQGTPLELIALSACRTALGDPDSELGFAGLALQAGARSAIGTLWYVDDVATSAFFVQFYRFLDAGQPKAEALRSTRIAFEQGTVRLMGDKVLGANDSVLLTDLTSAQQRRIAGGMQHPFFWSGIQLMGTPW